MAAWPSCSGPRQPAVKELGGGPVHHVRLTELERLAGPSAPCSATPHVGFDLIPRTSQRAEECDCTRSSYGSRLSHLSGALLLLKTGADFPIGPTLAYQFEPEWLDWLARLDENGILSVGLTQEDEHAIRQLRNRGLIDHDGPWLFTPTRSERACLSPRGQFLLHLAGQKGGDVAEDLARDVVRSLGVIPKGSHLFALLKRLQWSGHFTQREEPSVRKLRNQNFVNHSTYFLAAADIVMPTDLGFYVLRTVRD